MSKPTTVEIAVYYPGAYDTVLHRVKIATSDDDTLNQNLAALRQLWADIEAELGEKGLV